MQRRPPRSSRTATLLSDTALFRSLGGAAQEGIFAKRADAAYVGRRTHSWVKVKYTRRQEFVLVGWKPSSAKARPFASLLLAQHEDGALVYKGNVGTGFDADTMAMLASKFESRARKRSEEHTSELQSLMRISYAVLCSNKKTQ